MALAELFVQIMLGSMMDNSKMEHSMDTPDIFLKVVAVINMNVKMVRK